MPLQSSRAPKSAQPLLWLVPIVALLVGTALFRGAPRNAERAAKPKASSATDERATAIARENASRLAESSNPEPHAPDTDREATIFAALETDVRLDFIDRRLDDVLQDLAGQLRVPLWFDRQTLHDEGVTLDQPVTIRVLEITGRSALRLLLRPVHLTWLVEDDVLKITTTTKASEILETKIYDVTDLVVVRDFRTPSRYEFNSLMNVIESSVAPDSWNNLSGPGSISPLQSAETRELVIRQTQAVHAEIRALLADLRKARRSGPTEEIRPIMVTADDSIAARRGRAIRQALDRTVKMNLPARTVEEQIVEIARQIDVPLVCDRATLRDEGVRIDEPVVFQHVDINARSALKLLLEPIQLTWIIRDEVLLITTSAQAGEFLEVKVYDVGDIVPAFRDQNGNISHDFTSLANTLTSSIQPDGWEEGNYNLPVFRYAGILALIIRQTQAVQEEIATFLEDLRTLRRHWTGAPLVEWDSQKFTKSQSVQWNSRPFGLADPRRDALVRGNNQFALDLYRKLAGERGGNLVTSPVGICNALGAVYAGAHGETAREISETMHLIVRQEDVPTAFASLRAPLAVWAAWDARAHPPSQLWHHQGIEYLESFKKVLRDSYATKIASLDYSDLEHAAQAVNDWNISQTRGSTLRLASAGDFNDVNRLLITNAVHFNRKWSEPFRQKATHLERFAAPGTPVEVAMMHLAASRCRYATVDGVQILEKPYGDGDLSMLILLPPAGEKGLAELEGSLTEVILMKFLAATADNKVEVFLPRFKVESVFNLRQHLEALGMRLPFDAQAADLSGISERQKLALGPVIHKAFVEVDEEGPPTDPGRQPSFGAAEEPSPDQPVFRADHPFVFLIRDNHTGAIVFIGRLVTPGP